MSTHDRGEMQPIYAAALVFCGALVVSGCAASPRWTYGASAESIRARVPDLQPGMTVEDVTATLGLSRPPRIARSSLYDSTRVVRLSPRRTLLLFFGRAESSGGTEYLRWAEIGPSR